MPINQFFDTFIQLPRKCIEKRSDTYLWMIKSFHHRSEFEANRHLSNQDEVERQLRRARALLQRKAVI